MRRVVFFGATRGMGRALSRCMVERGDALCLLGRDPENLERSRKDLEIRGAGQPVYAVECDLLRRDDFVPALDAADQALGEFDTVVLTAGQFASQSELEAETDLRDELLIADFVNAVHFCEEARVRLLARGGGTLCVFSSVAGDRARKPVALYGAAKAGLSHYLEGLDHRYRREGLTTVDVRPGFVKTGMTASLNPPPFAGEPEQVAEHVLRALERGQPVVYTPPIWRLVMTAIRLLPRSVLRRLDL